MILLEKNQVETMTSPERISGLHRALISVYENGIKGDFVECGVYKGGNIIIAKKFFDSVEQYDINFYCFDTFSGMTEPGEKDSGKAHKTWNKKAKCEAALNVVLDQFKKHQIYDNRIQIIEGDVRETLLSIANLPEKISILRLDTDFYDSTKIELETLFSKLSVGGFLIIDDYGHWQGCKAAVDEFFTETFVQENFEKLDYTGIMWQKK